MSEDLAPIALEDPLDCGAEYAFATYTVRIGEWWDPRYTANPETLETVTIQVEDGGCTVRFAHGGWTETNVAARQKFGDWRVMLDRFAALADTS